MGNNCCPKRKQKRKIVLLLLGLDNAGKTVTVKNLSGEPKNNAVPTIGFSIISLRHSNYEIKVYDLGGSDDFRDIWERYYVDAHGIIFVVDSSDFNRLPTAQNVLYNIMANKKIQGKPVLLLANKQDQECALDEIDLIERLDLESLANTFECPTLVKSCCANSDVKMDAGIKSGYDWITKYIIREYATLNERVVADVEEQEHLDAIERAEKIARIKFLNEQENLISFSENIINVRAKEDNNMVKENGIKNTERGTEDLSIKNTEDLSIKNTDDLIMKDLTENMAESSNSSESAPNNYSKEESKSRPQSATSMVRKQLEMDGLQRRLSFKLGHNKTKPLNLYGVSQSERSDLHGDNRIWTASSQTSRSRRCLPKSASMARSSSGGKVADRRNLRSAGDSVFVISKSNNAENVRTNRKNSNSVETGAGDLSVFYMQAFGAHVTPLNHVQDTF